MNIRRIEVFVAIYKSGSITAAAEQLSLTKSAVSQALSALERDLKTPLFIRESRKLLATQTAESLFANVSPLIESIFQVYRTVTQESVNMVGSISIGAPPDLSSTYLIPCLSEFTKRHPGVQCHLTLGTPITLGDLLVKNQLDFAIIDAADVFEKMYPISTRLLSREKQVLVASSQYLRTNGSKDFSYDRFCDEKFVSHRSDAVEIKFWSKHHFKKVPRNLEVTLVVDQVAAIKSAVLHGFGFGHLPKRLVSGEVKNGMLVEWPTSISEYENRISLAQLAGKKPLKIEKLVVNFICQYFEEKRLGLI